MKNLKLIVQPNLIVGGIWSSPVGEQQCQTLRFGVWLFWGLLGWEQDSISEQYRSYGIKVTVWKSFFLRYKRRVKPEKVYDVTSGKLWDPSTGWL